MRDIIDYISNFEEGTKYYITAPILRESESLTVEKIKKEILDAGFIRFLLNGQEFNVNNDFELPK
jgi:excinuclease UvrABC ATPase subunit